MWKWYFGRLRKNKGPKKPACGTPIPNLLTIHRAIYVLLNLLHFMLYTATLICSELKELLKMNFYTCIDQKVLF